MKMYDEETLAEIKECIDSRGRQQLWTDVCELRQECETYIFNFIESRNAREHRINYGNLKRAISMLNGAVLSYMIVTDKVDVEDVF